MRALRRLGQHSAPLVYGGADQGFSGQVSSCIAIGDTLVRAGLGAERDVRPASVAAWAGIRDFTATGQIEHVARRLGIRSLDRTARFIG